MRRSFLEEFMKGYIGLGQLEIYDPGLASRIWSRACAELAEGLWAFCEFGFLACGLNMENDSVDRIRREWPSELKYR